MLKKKSGERGERSIFSFKLKDRKINCCVVVPTCLAFAFIFCIACGVLTDNINTIESSPQRSEVTAEILVFYEEPTLQQVTEVLYDTHPLLLKVSERTEEDNPTIPVGWQVVEVTPGEFRDYAGFYLFDSSAIEASVEEAGFELLEDSESETTYLKVQALLLQQDYGSNILNLIAGRRISISVPGAPFAALDRVSVLLGQDMSTKHRGDIETIAQVWRQYRAEKDGQEVTILVFYGAVTFPHGQSGEYHPPGNLVFVRINDQNWLTLYIASRKQTPFEDENDCKKSYVPVIDSPEFVPEFIEEVASWALTANGVDCNEAGHDFVPDQSWDYYVGTPEDPISPAEIPGFPGADLQNAEDPLNLGQVDGDGINGVNINWVEREPAD